MLFLALGILAVPVFLIVLLIVLIRRRKKEEKLAKEAGTFRQLPFWSTIKASYKLAWHYRMAYLKISWLWLILSGIFVFSYNIIVTPYMDDPAAIDPKHMDFTQVGHYLLQTILFVIPVNLLRITIGASIAVAWHRLILRHELPTEKTYLRLDRVVGSYFGLALFIAVLSEISTLIDLAATYSGSSSGYAIGGLVSFIALLFLLKYQVRLVVLLPAKALEEPNRTLRETMDRTRFSFWRLFWGPLFCSLPVILWEIIYWAALYNTKTNQLWYSLNFVVEMLVFMPVFLTFLSLSYQHFFEERHAVTNG